MHVYNHVHIGEFIYSFYHFDFVVCPDLSFIINIIINICT